MQQYGYIKVASAVPEIKVADCDYNYEKIIELIDKANKSYVDIIVFPELCITGYTCADLFYQTTLLNSSEQYIKKICEYSNNIDMLIIIGAPVRTDNQLFNCAIAINKGKILGIVPKTYLPNYNEFYEKRWFSSAFTCKSPTTHYCDTEVPIGKDLLFQHNKIKDIKLAIEICEDLWSPIPPSSKSCINGALLIANPSASNDLIGKSDYRRSLLSQQSARCLCGYIYTSSGFGESSTDVVFGGDALICENGSLLQEAKRYQMESHMIIADIDYEKLLKERQRSKTFYEALLYGDDSQDYRIIPFYSNESTDTISREIDAYPFVPNEPHKRNDRCQEIYDIQTLGLAKRIKHVGCKSVVLAISGGLDSTLALLVCTKTFDKLNIDRKNIVGITMPGFGTTDRTYNNSINLMKSLNITIKEISIKDACIQHFKDIEHDVNVHDVCYENSQARERTQIIMDYANKIGGLAIGTGDLSELALGWATYNGDHMSMYGVNAGIPKTLVRYLVKWIADYEVNKKASNILLDILDTPVSPELLPPDKDGKIAQKTEEVVGPYELHDFYLYNILRYNYTPKKIYFLACRAFNGKHDKTTILKWLKTFYRRFFAQQFKRSCLPDGPKVGSICLSPRGDLRMPSDASANIWLKELDEIVID